MNIFLGTSILGAVAVSVIVFFTVPIIADGNTNICQDVEAHNVKSTASNIAGGSSGPVYNVINSVGQMGATGSEEAAKQSSLHPDTPTLVSCTTAFWESL